jgi:signal transduction histidine kinase
LFRYKLAGVDEKWVNMQGNNSVLYNKLPHGEYRFEVKGSYDGKTWSKPLVTYFTIATPWFQSRWFFASLILFAAAAIYLLFNYRLQQKLKILMIRNRLHRDLHDDVGATLSSVKAYSEILSNDPGNAVIAGLIKDNAADMIERLEVIAWATSPKYDSFGSLVDKISLYATPACAANHIRFRAIENGIERSLAIPGEIRQTLYLVAKEAINNANKYSAAASCLLTAEIHNNLFTLEITDDGKGFNGALNGTGNGLQNIAERLQEAGGKAVINSIEGKGTTISISLPFPFKITN